MAKTTVIELIDDIDGGAAVETIVFGIDNSLYEIDLSRKNAAAMRRALKPYLAAGRKLRKNAVPPAPAGKTLMSTLSDAERERFRVWANMPNARWVADTRVAAWIEAGRP